ncbi:BamA/TamA family outer membrane protein [Cyclobacteriaceae bacterium]|nr:BamA/TamA family outer membrane protein [Cyclobacteriaceae bacterium]
MKRLLTLYLFLISTILVAQQPNIPLNYYSPVTYIINKIEVTGTQTLNDAIISMSGLQEGDEIQIPGNQITAAVKNIWAQNIVDDVRISITKVEGVRIDLEIYVHELPRVEQFDIVGQIKKSERRDILEQINVVRGQRFTASLEKNTKNIIEKYLQNKGYYYAKANVKDSLYDYGSLKSVIYTVKKGKKVKIKKLTINGANKVEAKKITSLLKNTKKKQFYRLWKRSKYIPDEYNEDKELLSYYYNSLGLRDFKISSSKVTRHKDPRFIDLTINLSEGKKYYFGKIRWIGNYKYDDVILDSILDIREGDVYNQQLLDTRLNFNPKGLDISSLYLDNGYLFFNVNPIEISIRDSVIDIEMKMYEGEQATYNKIIVKGNTKTNDHVILREIRTYPGEKFSRSDLIRTQRELAALGYFDPELIGINPKPNPATGTVDIEYTVTEKPNDQLQLSGGWGGVSGFVGTLGLSFNNFSLRNITKPKTWDPLPGGDGQRLSLRFQANFNFLSYSLSFTEPWLGGRKPNSLTVSYSHSRQKAVSGSSIDSDGTLKIDALTVSLGRRLKWPDNWFTLINSLSLKQYTNDNFSSLIENGVANNFAFTTTLARNNIGSNPQYPTHGGNMSVSLALTPPYSLFNDGESYKHNGNTWVEYHKWMLDFSQFMQLNNLEKSKNSMFTQTKQKRSFVLVTRAHWGFIGRYTKSLEPSEYERFNMGGAGLTGFNTSAMLLGTEVIGLRGYEDETVVTSDGGHGLAFNKYVLELRYPVIMSGMATIYVLGFMEGGNNFARVEEFNPFNIRRSAGFGARIFMPAFGLIGIDYGKGFDEIPGIPGANRGQIHFSIGQQLR